MCKKRKSKVAYTTRDAAAAASVSHHAILNAIRAGALTAHIIGATFIIEHSELRDWVLSLATTQS